MATRRVAKVDVTVGDKVRFRRLQSVATFH
jgi:hypothetical protein